MNEFDLFTKNVFSTDVSYCCLTEVSAFSNEFPCLETEDPCWLPIALKKEK